MIVCRPVIQVADKALLMPLPTQSSSAAQPGEVAAARGGIRSCAMGKLLQSWGRVGLRGTRSPLSLSLRHYVRIAATRSAEREVWQLRMRSSSYMVQGGGAQWGPGLLEVCMGICKLCSLSSSAMCRSSSQTHKQV